MKKLFLIAAVFVIVLSTFSLLAIPVNANSLVWSTPTQLTGDSANDGPPTIFQDSSGKVWVLFTSDRSGAPQIWYIASADQGSTWSSPQLFPPGTHYIAPLNLFEDSAGRLYMAWGRWTGPSEEDIYISTSDDLGALWSDSRLLQNSPFPLCYSILHSS